MTRDESGCLRAEPSDPDPAAIDQHHLSVAPTDRPPEPRVGLLTVLPTVPAREFVAVASVHPAEADGRGRFLRALRVHGALRRTC